MDIRELNSIFGPDGKPRSDGVANGVQPSEPLRSEKSTVIVHEYRIGDTLVLVPDGSVARAAGEPFTQQAVDASLAIQGRIDELRVDPAHSGVNVLIYTPNAEDGQLAVTAGYANGINTVAVDNGLTMPVSSFTEIGQRITAAGGEIRSGGQIVTIREHPGAGSPVNVVDVNLTSGTGGVTVSPTTAGSMGKDIAKGAALDFLADAGSQSIRGEPAIGLSAFGPTAVIDARGDGILVVGSLVNIVIPGSRALTLT